jgi:hypothetical protein
MLLIGLRSLAGIVEYCLPVLLETIELSFVRFSKRRDGLQYHACKLIEKSCKSIIYCNARFCPLAL